MRLERTHAEFVGEGESLLVVGFGLVDVWGIMMHSNVAEEAERVCFVGSPFVHMGKM